MKTFSFIIAAFPRILQRSFGMLSIFTLCGVLLPVSSASATATLTLTKSSATLLESSAVFGGIVHDGSRLVVSYAKSKDLYVRPFDTSFKALASATKITSVGTVMDHKHIFFNNAHYLVYSTTGDNDLYLIKLDTNLSQSGSTVTVTQDSTTTMTNDMLLATDGTYIITGQFRPSNLNGNATSGHLVKRYDTSLNYVSPDITVNKFEHTNTASLLKIGSYMIQVAPSGFVKGGQVQTQLDLLLMRYDTSFNAIDTAAKKIVDSSTIKHSVNGDGIWMSTGLAYDAMTDKILVGHTFRDGASGSDTGKIHLRVFDGASFTQTYTETMVDSVKANRAHFLLQGDTLYVVYDDTTSGSPAIYGMSYALTRDSSMTPYSDCLFNWAEIAYPQFFTPAGATSQVSAPYYYRYYSGTGNYLATSASDGKIWGLGPYTGGKVLEIGAPSSYLSTAGCTP